MRSALLAAFVLPMLMGCHDWDKEYSGCVTSGKCGELITLSWTSPPPRSAGDFGDVPGAALVASTVTLSNLGSSPVHDLTVTLTSATPDTFAVLGGDSCDTSEFAAGGTCSLRVGFVPRDLATFTGRLTAHTAEGPSTLQLRGVGVSPTYLLTLNQLKAHDLSVNYVDDSLGPIPRTCGAVQQCFYGFLKPTMVTIDVGDSGASRGPIWSGACVGTVGAKCMVDVNDSEPKPQVGIDFLN